MLYNYHTHTSRCGHANGLDREYVEAAIEAGIKTLGFADHAPMIFPEEANGYKSWFRIKPEEVEDYVNSIYSLKEAYKDQIEIHVGAEMEYYPKCFDENYRRCVDYGFEYLILGQHFNRNEFDGAKHILEQSDTKGVFTDYVDTVVNAMKTEKFIYVAHPDVTNFNSDDDFYNEQMARICKTSIDLDIPLEVNMLGRERKRIYPNDKFWKLAGKMGVRAIVGVDAHDPQALVRAEAVISEYEPFLNENNIDVSRETFVNFDVFSKRRIK